MKQSIIVIFWVFLWMVFSSFLPAYAQEKQGLEDLLTNVVEDLTPALDSMRRHKNRLEEKFSGDRPAENRRAPRSFVPDPPHPELDRDPFATTRLMEQTATRGQKSGPDFTPLPAASATPDLKLRGIVSGADGARLALLDVSGRDVYLVREGDTISLYGAERNTVIKVLEMNHLTLTVTVGTLGEMVIVR